MKVKITPPQLSIIFLTFILMVFTNKTGAQNYLVQAWMHTTGIPDTVDWSASTTDGSGNIYVTTNTFVDGEKANFLTTKYNSSGVVQWEETYNSSDNDNDYGTAIFVDGSGNVYVAGASYISGHNYDYRTIKYNCSGTLQWNVTNNGRDTSYDVPINFQVIIMLCKINISVLLSLLRSFKIQNEFKTIHFVLKQKLKQRGIDLLYQFPGNINF